MRRLPSLLLLVPALAQQPPPAELQPPSCGDAEILEFGLDCTVKDACSIFLELAGIEQAGGRLFLTGNFHTGGATLWSLLLVSEDEGRTWKEAHPRIRGAVLEDIQFVDAEAGWVSGHIAGALPRDPFLLKTADAGRSWRRVPIFEDGGYGVIDAFRFQNREQGVLLLERRGEPRQRYQRWESRDGGDTWTLREAGAKPFPPLRPGSPGWRIRTDVRTKHYLVERQAEKGWTSVARFPVRMGECRTAPEPAEPPSVPPPKEIPPQ